MLTPHEEKTLKYYCRKPCLHLNCDAKRQHIFWKLVDMEKWIQKNAHPGTHNVNFADIHMAHAVRFITQARQCIQGLQEVSSKRRQK